MSIITAYLVQLAFASSRPRRTADPITSVTRYSRQSDGSYLEERVR